MAGTRLLVHTVYSIQVIALVIISILLAKRSDDLSDDSPLSMFTNRKGASALPKVMRRLLSLKGVISEGDVVVNVRIRWMLVNSGSDVGNPETELDWKSQKGVRREVVSSKERIVCDDSKWEDVRHLFSTPDDESNTVVVLWGCGGTSAAPAALEIHESGDILVRMQGEPQNMLRAEEGSPLTFQDLLIGPVADACEGLLTSNPMKKTPGGTPRTPKNWNVVVTLVDEDPASHGGDGDGCSTTPAEHHQRMGELVSTSVGDTVSPLLRKLSPLIGGTLRCRTVLLPSSLNIRTLKEGYSVTSMEDVASLLQTKTMKPQLYMDLNMHATPVNFAVYLPSRTHSPLYITHNNSIAGTNSTSAYLPGKGGLTILSIPPPCSPDSIARQAFLETATFITTQIRLMLFLSSRLPHQTHHPAHSMVKVAHLPSRNPLTEWEFNGLIRYWIPRLLEEVVTDALGIVGWMMEYTQGVRVDPQMAEDLDEITTLLERSIILTGSGDTREALSVLQSASNILQRITTNPEMMQKPHFPWEHLLALFSPNILPLLGPVIVGFVKEGKRYRRLTQKKEINQEGGDSAIEKDKIE